MSDYVEEGLKRIGITISKPLLATVCIIFGIFVIAFPSLLVWTVGLFMMIQGTLLFTEYFEQGSQVASKPAANWIFCNSCGDKNREDSTFCKDCGAQLTQTEQVITSEPQKGEPKELVEPVVEAAVETET